jgi:hypothetical protein
MMKRNGGLSKDEVAWRIRQDEVAGRNNKE